MKMLTEGRLADSVWRVDFMLHRVSLLLADFVAKGGDY